MAIKRGEPGAPRVPPRPQAEQRRPAAASQEPARTEAPRTEASRPEASRADETREAREVRAAFASFESDGFDDDFGVTRTSPGERAEDVFRAESRTSLVRNTERLLETTYERLTHDFRAVHAEAQALVAALAQEGFSPDAVAAASEQLRAHRARMTKVRARLSSISRRLRALSLPAGSALDANLRARLGAQIRAAAELERGVDRTLLALTLAANVRPRAADGKPAALVRIDVQGTRDRAALGSELARQAPEAASTGTMLRLLTGEEPSAEAPSSSGEGSSDVEALRAFAAAQLGS